MAYITSEQYRDAVFSQDARHQLKVVFNGVELEDADNYCEKFTLKSRVMSNSSKVFSLDNFVSDEAQLILHDVDLEQIVGPVDIQIGTLVGESYEYVPIGIFNIQDLPTTDKNKTTIKLRDNSVKFDFDYNAKPLIDTNDGSATKLQILQDICSQAGVVCNIIEFIGSNDLIGIYDETIKARTYISYLAEQAGALPSINRYGELIFVYLNELVEQEIPIDLVESYKNGERFKIARVVYESGIIKYDKPSESDIIDGDKLYLNTANPYISTQEQVNSIYEIVKNFEINSFKTGKVIGNPAIDKYDIIKIVDGDKTFRTFATYNMTYNGKIIMTFETLIDQVKKQENVTKNSDESFRKFAKTSIDNLNNEIELMVSEVNEQNSKINQVTQTANDLNISISNQQTIFDNLNNKIVELEGTLEDMNFNFSTKGLAIGTSNDETNSLLDNTGVKVYSHTTLTAIFNNKGSGIDKLIVTGTAQLGYLKIMKTIEGGEKYTDIFHLENLIEDLEDLM